MKITSHASVVAETVQKILDVTITWKIEAAGKIDADIAVTKDDEFPDLPRFGVRMFLDKKLSAARYFGMGPQESYCDKHQAASHGLYHANVDDLHEDYIRPQENGSHYDCEYVELNNSDMELWYLRKMPSHSMLLIIRRKNLRRKRIIMN